MKKLSVILIGAGDRGNRYTQIMSEMPECFNVIAVAEPKESRRNRIRDRHNIPEDRCFDDWRELLALGKIADVAIISTMDRQHFEPTMQAIGLKYNILLEKPVSPDPRECMQIANAATENGVRVLVCHVLRYTQLFMTLKNLIDDGKIGNIISINHEECVGNVHQSHSFVRGNWSNSQESSFMLLQKSCHDLDILQWLIGKKCVKVQSFGSLTYFRSENTPDGAPEYCIEGCPVGETCPYNAVKLYLDDKTNDWFRGASTKKANPTDDDVRKAISTTQYGKCVYKCNNDVVDHQTVNMLFEDNITVTFTMNAFNKGGRYIHIMGTKGEIHAALEDGSYVRLYEFETKQETEIPVDGGNTIVEGHGGGDRGIIESLYQCLASGIVSKSLSDIQISCDNHMIVFAAEFSRNHGTVVDLEEFKKICI